ncbi:MAG: MBL fold metallo-hydrolase [Candidatus Gastranaerophilaceae bacterium]
MIVETFVLGMLENNNYLLIDEVSKEAVLVDCSGYTDDFQKTLDKHNANLKYILITHGHFDHILGLNKIHEKYPNVPIYAPIGDKDLINEVDSFVDRYLGGFGRIDVPPITKYIDSNENLTIGLENIKIIQAPGHTKGGVCYFVDDKLFSGDTIFLESVGRTDLPGGNFEQLKSSIVNILANLSDDIVIYTGHGMTTTVKHEKENNPVL